MLKRLFSSHKKTGDKRKVKKRVAEIVGVLALGILLSVNIFTTYAGTAPAAPIGTEGYFMLYIEDVTDITNITTSIYKIHLMPYNTDGSAVWSNKAYETRVSQQYAGGPNSFDFSVTAGTAKEDGWAAADPGVYGGTRYFVIPINIDVRSVNGNSEIYIKDEVGLSNTTEENGTDLDTLHAQHELGSAHMTIELDTNNVGLTNLHVSGKETHCIITIKIDRKANTLTANPNGGKFSDTHATGTRDFTVKIGEQTNCMIPAAYKSGQEFLGWYTSSGQKVYNADGTY